MSVFNISLERIRPAVAERQQGLDAEVRVVLLTDLEAILADWERLDGIIRSRMLQNHNPVEASCVHVDPDLEPGEYIVKIETKGGAPSVNMARQNLDEGGK